MVKHMHRLGAALDDEQLVLVRGREWGPPLGALLMSGVLAFLVLRMFFVLGSVGPGLYILPDAWVRVRRPNLVSVIPRARILEFEVLDVDVALQYVSAEGWLACWRVPLAAVANRKWFFDEKLEHWRAHGVIRHAIEPWYRLRDQKRRRPTAAKASSTVESAGAGRG